MSNKQFTIAVSSPIIQLANCVFNAQQIITAAKNANAQGVDVLVTPALGLTGITCGDLFLQESLQSASEKALEQILKATATLNTIIILGLPLKSGKKLFNCAVSIKCGEILAITPKNITAKNTFANENLYFASAEKCSGKFDYIEKTKADTVFPTSLNVDGTKLDIFFLDDYFMDTENEKQSDADIIINLSSVPEYALRAQTLRKSTAKYSAQNSCTTVLVSASSGESTTDFMFSGYSLVSQNGNIIAQSKAYSNKMLISSFHTGKSATKSPTPSIETSDENTSPMPFFPNETDKVEFCESILDIQAHALASRFQHTHAEKLVLGISGGLDSTLALIVCKRTMDILARPYTDIAAFSMPCFGTTTNSRSNAANVSISAGVSFEEIDISSSVLQHFKDIGHDPQDHSVVFENAQARMRTLLLMSKANKLNGFVVGTGDLSELALGWATFNGDHMSMYCVNGGVPKTLVRYLVAYIAQKEKNKFGETLKKIVLAPISPELLPTKDGDYSQLTEDSVGPYELHDFFIYHLLKYKETPSKIYALAKIAFGTIYSSETIKKWLAVFFKRFFQQQFKRNCMPEGPSIFGIGLSPRSGGFAMPSDALATIWLNEIEQLT